MEFIGWQMAKIREFLRSRNNRVTVFWSIFFFMQYMLWSYIAGFIFSTILFGGMSIVVAVLYFGFKWCQNGDLE